MVMTRSMTRNQNYDASSRMRKNICGGVPSHWSDLNHDVLYSVMMRLGAIEFISFSAVCKSWRSLALSNRNKFMASKPPMLMWISHNQICHLEDFEGRKFKTMIPQLVGRKCVGLSCGYLILFGEKTRDFRLVNLITRHELHFPNVSFDVVEDDVRAVLVFSPSINRWVFVTINRTQREIWFSIEGKGAWNYVFSTIHIFDLHAFKGKIYTLNFLALEGARFQVCEMRLNPVPKLMETNTHFVDSASCIHDFISSDENLYLMEYWPINTYRVHKLGFEEMIWAPCEKTRQEYVLFHSRFKFSAAVKPEPWAAPSSQYTKFFDTKKRGKDKYYIAKMWYFPHDCLNVNLIDG